MKLAARECDFYKYRGHGLNQLTFRGNYQRHADGPLKDAFGKTSDAMASAELDAAFEDRRVYLRVFRNYNRGAQTALDEVISGRFARYGNLVAEGANMGLRFSSRGARPSLQRCSRPGIRSASARAVALGVVAAFLLGQCRKPDASAGTEPDAAVSSSAAVRPPAMLAPSPGIVDAYRGCIGDNLRVIMRLHNTAGTVEGSYFYEKKGVDLRVSGHLDGRALDLRGLSGATPTGTFRGSIGDDGKIAGTWSDPTGARALPFAIEPIARRADTSAALVYMKTLRYSVPVIAAEAGEDVCKGKVMYPELFGLPDEGVERALNARLSPNEVVRLPQSCDSAREVGGGYDLAKNADGVLSVSLFSWIWDSSAAHPSRDDEAVNVFLGDGHPLSLFGDVLEPGTEAVLTRALTAQINKAAGGDATARDALRGALGPPYDDFVLEQTVIRFSALSRLPHALQGLNGDGFRVPYAALRLAQRGGVHGP
ncbi:MAG: hypothetical protein M3O50_21585 [Myxococcota bacterium]|nr:hypothetical protein [Myxococcota bacterium]